MKKINLLQKLQNFVLQSCTLQGCAFKRLILVILVIFVIFVIPTVKADTSFQIKIDDVLNKKNITITHPVTKEKYLLYLGIGCNEMTKGQNVSLVIKGALNGGDDIIKENSLYQCTIQNAVVYTNKLFVSTVFGENTKAYVQDENKNEYYISFGPNCASIEGYKNNYIYAFQAGAVLAKSDKIIIPANGGQCSILYLERSDLGRTQTSNNNSDRVPTTVSDVKVYPRNGSVYLSWRPAKDDKGISYYMIGYSHSSVYTKDILPENMPNKVRAQSTRYTVTGLENDLPYYFYIIAVDTGGNTSSDWSEGVMAVPKSSIMPDKTVATDHLMNLRVALENTGSFLIRWTPISGYKQTVKFQVDGKIVSVQYQYGKSYISISKKTEYKGKKLTVIIKATDIRGTVKEEKIDF